MGAGRGSWGRLLARAVGLGLCATLATAQSCINYGIVNGTACECPEGLGGTDCSSLACGNAIAAQESRPLFSVALAGDGGARGCGAQCSDGWGGPTCNVCQSDLSCSGTTTGTPSIAGQTVAGDVTCSTSPWAWTQSFVSCDVVNPTLQGVFPGTTTLTISKLASDPSLALSSTFGTENGTTQAQLWYASNTGNGTITEQFFCQADSCAQTNVTATSSVDWTCQNLQCTCIPGTLFCGGGGPLDLTNTIDGLSGELAISCSTTQAGSCAFKQSVLQTLFGSSGLALSGCTFGECVRRTTINQIADQLASNGTTAQGRNGLSGGVIAGLAVLGFFLLLLVAFVVFGCVRQRQARRVPSGTLDPNSSRGVGMKWTNVSYTLPPVSKGLSGIFAKQRTVPSEIEGGVHASSSGSAKGGRLLLDGVSGAVKPGSMLSILGPSGAGKSTLVDILAGKRKVGTTSGQVRIERAAGSQGAGKVRVGFVDQSDVLSGWLTVREALAFAAKLKLGEDISAATRDERVWAVITQLGLVDVADSIIGTDERRGISGGERRRLSIGLELISAPSVLICDEPTSGLDSVSALKVIKVLRDLTHDSGTTVITTIHQPSSQIFDLFDEVAVLAVGGRQVYFGRAQDVRGHYEKKGRICPAGWNVADFLLEIASDRNDTSRADTSESSEKIARSHTDGSRTSESLNNDKEGSGAANETAELSQRRKPQTTLLTQFEALSWREMKNLKRDWSLIVMHNAVAAIVGLFVGGMFYKVNDSIGGFQSRVGSLFFLGSLLAFSSLSALSNFIHVRSLFLRERASAYYHPVAWFLSRVAFDIIPLRIFPTILVSVIVYWMVGLHASAASFFKYLLILIEYNIATTLFNLFLAAMVHDSGIAILLSAVLDLFQMAFAGFFINLPSIPAVLRWLQWLSPLKYCLEALSVNEVGSGLLIRDSLQGVQVEISAELIMGILFGFQPTAYYRDVLVLFGFIAGFAIMLVAAVLYKLRELR